MKNSLIALAAIALTGTAFSPAASAANPDMNGYLGFRASVDVTASAGQAANTFGNGPGFSVGAIYNLPLTGAFYLEPGASLFYNTFDVNEVKDNSHGANTINGSIRNWGVRVPVNLGFRLTLTDDIAFSLFTGPVVNFNMSADKYLDGPGVDILGKYYRNADLQWNYGVGLNYAHSYYVSVAGYGGLTRVYKSPIDHFRRNMCSVTIGYNF